jgi:hypothetical protein
MRFAVLLLAACSQAAPRPTPPKPPSDEDMASALAPMMPPGSMKDFTWTPEMGADKAERMFANVRVLGDVTATRFMASMFATGPALGVKCDHCHDPEVFVLDEKGAKHTARRMLLMIRELNDRSFGGETRVSCWTCHRGQARPEGAPGDFPARLQAVAMPAAMELSAEQAGLPGHRVWRNLQLLRGRKAGQLRNVMAAFTVSLGVGCAHCHVEGDFASDAKAPKRRARDMLRMVARANAHIGGRGAASCWTCHRGRVDPPRFPDAVGLRTVPD